MFDTPFGLYKWKRLPFGVSAASEIFQKDLFKVVGNLSGVLCVAEDIIVYGVGDNNEEAMKDHDKHLKILLQSVVIITFASIKAS